MIIAPVIHILDEQQTWAELAKVHAAGVQKAWIIHHGGDDSLTMSIAQKSLRVLPDLCVGVNLLNTQPRTAVYLAREHGISNIWLDFAEIFDGCASEAAEEMLQMSMSVDMQIYAGISFKYQPKDPSEMRTLERMLSYGWIPTTSGSSTGSPADERKLERLSNGGTTPLAVASGVSIDNIAMTKQYCCEALVASSIATDEYHINVVKLKNLLDAAM